MGAATGIPLAPSGDYRRDVDGLRGLAVAGVVLFHAGIPTFSGGFVGVDVFFVISGYLIAGVLLSAREVGTLSLAMFYARRARRLLPALAVVLAASAALAWLWLPPLEFRGLGADLTATALFASNWRFALHHDYFGGALDANPLLHTWSLAVEEQFYLLFPLLILATSNRRLLMISVAVLAVASLSLAAWMMANYPKAAYFATPTRAWELLAGVLCAFWRDRASARVVRGSNRPWGTIGLWMLGIAMIVYSPATQVPGLPALLPVAGTMLVLVFGVTGRVGRLLVSRPLVGLGLISYSVYLWHQPVFVFAQVGWGLKAGIWSTAALVGICVLLGWLSWRWVEQPWRTRHRTNPPCATRQLTTAAATVAMLASSGWFLATVAPAPTATASAVDVAWDRGINCSYPTSGYRQVLCGTHLETASDADQRVILFLGDSLLMASSGGLQAAAAELGLRVNIAAKWACPGLLGASRIREGRVDRECAEFNRAVFDLIRTDSVTHVVLYSAFNRYLRNGNAGAAASRACTTAASCQREFASAMVETLSWLRTRGVSVAIVQQPPDFALNFDDSLPRIALREGLESLRVPASAYVRDSRQFHATVDDTVLVIRPGDIFCDELWCSPVLGDRLAYVDSDHPSAAGSLALIPVWRAALQDLLNQNGSRTRHLVAGDAP